MRRHLLGIFGFVLVLGGLVALARFGWQDAGQSTLIGACLRAGLVIVAMWLAYPQLVVLLTKYPPALIATVGLAAFLLIAAPRLIFLVIPIAIAVLIAQFFRWLFRPLPTGKRRRPKEPQA